MLWSMYTAEAQNLHTINRLSTVEILYPFIPTQPALAARSASVEQTITLILDAGSRKEVAEIPLPTSPLGRGFP